MAWNQPLAANEDLDPDRAARDAIFLEHSAWLKSVLRRRYGPDLAEELAQETYLRLAPYQPGRPIDRPRALLLRIAVNLAHDRRRRVERAPPEPDPEPILRALPSPARQLSSLMIKQVILSLPPKLRDVFILSQVRGLTHAEIAELLDVSAKTVEWRMGKAMAACAKAMRD